MPFVLAYRNKLFCIIFILIIIFKIFFKKYRINDISFFFISESPVVTFFERLKFKFG